MFTAPDSPDGVNGESDFNGLQGVDDDTLIHVFDYLDIDGILSMRQVCLVSFVLDLTHSIAYLS